jgi:hypothetical protein
MYLKMDFPDQWVDVENIDFGGQNFLDDSALPSSYTSYQQVAYDAIRNKTIAAIATDKSLTTAGEQLKRLEQNEGAECLYSIVMFIRGEVGYGNWQKVNEDYIGDTDGDTAQEFLDGWGRPISFIRWPSGFKSDLQNGQPGAITDISDIARSDHDPFDPIQTDNAYRLVPLIVSAGPDGLFDMATVKLDYNNINTDRQNGWNPYYINGGRRAGETGYDQNNNQTEDWHDNIHNHLISTR